MKRSNTGLFIIIGFAALLIIVTIVGARIVVGNIFGSGGNYKSERMDETSGETQRVLLTYDFGDFQEIEVSGAWTINITQGEDYSVTVHCPERIKDVIEIKQRGNRLYFEDVFRFTRLQSGSINADITVPDLEKYEVDGAASVYISGFNQDRLDIEINGASSVKGEDNVFEHISVDLNGAGHVDFSGTETQDADVDIDGVGNVTLSITGGILDGSIEGLGTVRYYGEISDNRIDIEIGRAHV